MACDERWFELLSAYHDGEATPHDAARVQDHVAGCTRCAATLDRLGALRGDLRQLREPDVPARVRQRASGLAPPARPRRVASAALAVAAAAAVLFAAWPSARLGHALGAELEAHHLKAFARASPCEFESSDAAAVRRWVAANVGYGVEVPTIPGARLLGARRCKLRGVVTASLLYRRGDEALTVFLPRAGSDAQVEASRLARSGPRCEAGPLGDPVCAREGRFAVAESASTALLALEST